MQNKEINGISNYVSTIEIILSLFDNNKKTAYAIAKEHNKSPQEQRYREEHLPRLHKLGLLNIEETEKGTLYSLNYYKFWDLFFSYFSNRIKRKPTKEEMEKITEFLLNTPIIEKIREGFLSEGRELQKNDIEILFYELFIIFQTHLISLNIGDRIKEMFKQIKPPITNAKMKAFFVKMARDDYKTEFDTKIFGRMRELHPILKEIFMA